MRKIALAALFAVGFAFAGATGASSAPVTSGMSGLSTAEVNASLVEDVAVRCRRVTVCRRNAYGVRICRTERVCRRVW